MMVASQLNILGNMALLKFVLIIKQVLCTVMLTNHLHLHSMLEVFTLRATASTTEP